MIALDLWGPVCVFGFLGLWVILAHWSPAARTLLTGHDPADDVS